jgi:RNA polymerase sigma factor (sigma-70 family)
MTHDASSTDADLARSAMAGDRAAFAELIARHRQLLLAVCWRVLGNADLAQDASQEAVARALLVLDTLRKPEQFGPWLAGIGLNVCRRWLHQHKYAVEAWSWEALVGGARILEPVDPDPGVSPERAVEEQELVRVVRRAVDGLPPGQRAAVLLAYLAGLTQAETAASLGVPLGAVKTRLHKARLALRKSLWTTWIEEDVAMVSTIATDTEFVDVEVWDVRRSTDTPERPGRNVVLLREVGGERVLPIWVGHFEGDSIVILLEKVEITRPLTFSFAANVLQAAQGSLREVRVNRLTPDDGTFFAEAVIASPTATRIVDCRPSDAISLALAIGAPIRVAEVVMASQAQPREGFVEVPEGVSTAAEGAQRMRDMLARAHEEWTRIETEQAHLHGYA